MLKHVSNQELPSHFGTRAQSARAPSRTRWPAIFGSSRCGDPEHYLAGPGLWTLLQCGARRQQVSRTNGTVMGYTKMLLKRWFLAVNLINLADADMPALAFKRHLGVSHLAIWLVHRNICNAITHQRSSQRGALTCICR
jgi:hypothetical protein